ncbi:MAG: Holliday junction resolvase RuvX [Candidatus Saccharimonadales bacterium]
MPQPEYLMSLDVGDKRIGVALAHRIARLPQPLQTLQRTENVMADISQLIKEHEVGALVVGLPRGMDGQYTDQTRATEAFAAQLKHELDIPVYLSDETLTSVQAETELGSRARQDKGAIDALAATYILEDFLHNHPEVLAV